MVNDSAKDKVYDGTADVVVQSDLDYIFETSNTNGLKGEDINNYKLSLVSEGSLTAALSYAENSAILNYSSKYSNKKNAESASAGGINITFTSDKGGLNLIEELKNNYFVIVPILEGHNVNDKENFISFDICAKDIEEYYIKRYGNKVFAVYGMSMGGILASYIWKNKKFRNRKINIRKFSSLILE